MKVTHTEDYAKLRREEYPDIGDQLDAIWKAIEAGGIKSMTPEVKNMLSRIKSTKLKFKKNGK